VPTPADLRLPPTLIVKQRTTVDETAVAATAVFSHSRVYRYALTRQWNPGLPWLAYIGLNPSVADEFADDPTITRCRNRAYRLGAGGIVMLNLFAVRATNPRRMDSHPNPEGFDNDRVISEYLPVLQGGRPSGGCRRRGVPDRSGQPRRSSATPAVSAVRSELAGPPASSMTGISGLCVTGC